MKRVITVLFAFFVAVECFAQASDQFQFSFNIKSSRAKDADSLIQEYLTNYLHFHKTEDGTGYAGAVPAFESLREGLSKTLYSAQVSVEYEVNDRKASFLVCYTGVDKTTRICDKNQVTTCDHLAIGDLPKDLSNRPWYVAAVIIDSVRDFVNRDDMLVPEWFTLPAYQQTSYIIDDDSVTYYVVIPRSGMSQTELYEIADKYYTYDYLNGKAKIERRDPEKCLIAGNGLFSNIYKVEDEYEDDIIYSVPHIFSVQCRDGRVRASITISGIDVFSAGINKSYKGVVDNLPFGQQTDFGIETAIYKAEQMFMVQVAYLNEALQKGLSSHDFMEEW